VRARLERVRGRLVAMDRHLREAAERVTSRHPNKGTSGIDKQRERIRECIVDIDGALIDLGHRERRELRETEERREREPVDVDLDALRVSS
jgi:hypothetical protein